MASPSDSEGEASGSDADESSVESLQSEVSVNSDDSLFDLEPESVGVSLAVAATPPSHGSGGGASASGSLCETATCAFDRFEALVAQGRRSALWHCVSSCLAMAAGFAKEVVKRFGLAPRPAPAHPGLVVQKLSSEAFLFHMVTKQFANQFPSYSDFNTALDIAFKAAAEAGVSDVVMPRLGCGLDRLEWSVVEPMIRASAASQAPQIRVVVCSPLGTGGLGTSSSVPFIPSGTGGLGTSSSVPSIPSGTGGLGTSSSVPSIPSGTGGLGTSSSVSTTPLGAVVLGTPSLASVTSLGTSAMGPSEAPISSTLGTSAGVPATAATSSSHGSGGEENGTRSKRAVWLEKIKLISIKERPSWAARVAVEIAALAMVKTHRRQVRRDAVGAGIFPLSTKPRENFTCPPEEILKAGTSDVELSKALSYVLRSTIVVSAGELPAGISPLEPEALPKDAQVPAEIAEEWRLEKVRQMASPFEAGKVGTHRIEWEKEPPRRAPLAIWTWGRSLDVDALDAETKSIWAKLLAKELGNGSLRIVDPEEVAVLTPAFLVQHPVTRKWRLVHDLRAVNVLMKNLPCDYDRVTDALLLKGSFAMKLDLLAAFRHVAVHESDRRYMAFAIGPVCFVWNALPFGSGQSPAAFVKALKPVVLMLRKEGLRLVVYCDDILVVADDHPSLVAAMARTLNALRSSGWYVALDKMFPYAMSTVPFLGMLVDFVVGSVRVSVAKAEKVRLLALALSSRRTVSYAMLAKIGGVLAFCAQAAHLCKLARLGINAATAEAATRHSGAVAVKGALLEDLKFWVRHAKRLPSFQSKARAPGLMLVTDAAGPPAWGWGAVGWRADRPAPDVEEMFAQPKVDWLSSDGVVCAAGELDSAAPNPSSAAWELEAFVRAIQRLLIKEPALLCKTTVRWFSDSSAATAIVKAWRTKSAGTLRWLRVLFDLCELHDFDVEPVWVAREAGWQPIADWLSRLSYRRKQAEYHLSLDQRCAAIEALGSLPRNFDAFASPLEEVIVTSFATRWPCPGAFTDGLAAPWEHKLVWAFPPFGELPAVWGKVRAAPCLDVVIVHPKDMCVPEDLRARVVASYVLPEVPLIRSGGGAMRDPSPVPLMCSAIQ